MRSTDLYKQELTELTKSQPLIRSAILCDPNNFWALLPNPNHPAKLRLSVKQYKRTVHLEPSL